MTDVRNAIKTAIDLVSLAVRTAPKSGGVDDVLFEDITDSKEKIADEVLRIGQERAKAKADKDFAQAILVDWKSDAEVIRRSDGLVLIGVDGKHAMGANCGGCGFKDCAEFNKNKDELKGVNLPGPYCVFKIMDLGIALGSAAKTLSCLSVDSRIMYKIGVAAMNLGIAKVHPLIGIPLSATGKNIYFDRLDKLQARAFVKDKHKK
jgi:uncharacterized ferredoxin-like protein